MRIHGFGWVEVGHSGSELVEVAVDTAPGKSHARLTIVQAKRLRRFLSTAIREAEAAVDEKQGS